MVLLSFNLSTQLWEKEEDPGHVASVTQELMLSQQQHWETSLVFGQQLYGKNYVYHRVFVQELEHHSNVAVWWCHFLWETGDIAWAFAFFLVSRSHLSQKSKRDPSFGLFSGVVEMWSIILFFFLWLQVDLLLNEDMFVGSKMSFWFWYFYCMFCILLQFDFYSIASVLLGSKQRDFELKGRLQIFPKNETNIQTQSAYKHVPQQCNQSVTASR